MSGRVKTFTTNQLGTVSMDISKNELKTLVESKNLRYKETEHTILIKNEDDSNMIYCVFNEDTSKMMAVDLGSTELKSINIDDKEHNPDYIKDLTGVTRRNLLWCSRKNTYVELDSTLECNCDAGVKRENCMGAETIQHDVLLGESLVTYIDYGLSTDNTMFCIENNECKAIDYKAIAELDGVDFS